MKFFQAFQDRRLLTTLILGFSGGLPLALTGATLQAWLKDSNLDYSTIGLFSLVALPYGYKFLWAPLLDRYLPPLLGRRRGWLLIAQFFLMFLIGAMGLMNPAESPSGIAVLAMMVAFMSASQDIVIDAYRIELLPAELAPAGVGVYTTGYRIAMLVSGALALSLAERLSWPVVYGLMAISMLPGMLTTLLSAEPEGQPRPKSLADAFWIPLKDYFSRQGAIEILVFFLIYKLDAILASALLTVFLMDVGYSKETIGFAVKTMGMIATICGGLYGGALAPKLGNFKSLVYFGVLQAIANLIFCWIAKSDGSVTALYVGVFADYFVNGMATVAYSAFMISLCNKSFSATQYALFTSFMAITRTVGASPAGYLVEALGVVKDAEYAVKMTGWTNYFLVATLAGLPGLLMLLRYRHWESAKR